MALPTSNIDTELEDYILSCNKVKAYRDKLALKYGLDKDSKTFEADLRNILTKQLQEAITNVDNLINNTSKELIKDFFKIK